MQPVLVGGAVPGVVGDGVLGVLGAGVPGTGCQGLNWCQIAVNP